MGLSAESRSSGGRVKLLILKLEKNARQKGQDGAAVIWRQKTSKIINLCRSGAWPLQETFLLVGRARAVRVRQGRISQGLLYSFWLEMPFCWQFVLLSSRKWAGQPSRVRGARFTRYFFSLKAVWLARPLHACLRQLQLVVSVSRASLIKFKGTFISLLCCPFRPGC